MGRSCKLGEMTVCYVGLADIQIVKLIDRS